MNDEEQKEVSPPITLHRKEETYNERQTMREKMMRENLRRTMRNMRNKIYFEDVIRSPGHLT